MRYPGGADIAERWLAGWLSGWLHRESSCGGDRRNKVMTMVYDGCIVYFSINDKYDDRKNKAMMMVYDGRIVYFSISDKYYKVRWMSRVWEWYA